MDIAKKLEEQKNKNKARLENARQRIATETRPQGISGDELGHLVKTIRLEEDQTAVRDFANIEKFSSEISKQFSSLYNENTRKQELLKFLTALKEFPSLIDSIKTEAQLVIDKQHYEDDLLTHLVESVKTYEEVVTQLDIGLFNETKGTLAGVLEQLLEFSMRELLALDFKLQGKVSRFSKGMVSGDGKSDRPLSGEKPQALTAGHHQSDPGVFRQQ
jgi:hypothetical protein